MVELCGITLGGTDRPRLDQVSVKLPAGRTAIVGCSGAGKTSLLNVLAGYERPDTGEVRTEDVLRGPNRVAAASSRRGTTERAAVSMNPRQFDTGGEGAGPNGGRMPVYWVPQSGGLWPHLSVWEHVQLVSTSESADKFLSLLDLSHRRGAVPGELSMGERSRLALARAMAVRPELLLLDEPLAHVDPVRKPACWSVLRQFVEESGCSMIFTSHEPEIILQHATFVVCLHEGRVLCSGAASDVYHSPPERLAGDLLGPVTWFEPWDASLFLGLSASDSDSAVPVRPERLAIEPDSTGTVRLVSAGLLGMCRTSVIEHAASGRRLIVHHCPPRDRLAEGDGISLRVTS